MGATPRMQRQTPFDIFADRLKLNKDQKAEAQTVLTDAMKEAAPLRQQLAQAKAAIANAILGSKSEDDRKKIMDTYTSLVVQVTGLEAKAFAKVCANLKPNQQNKAGAAFEAMAGIFNTPAGGGGRRGRN
jgi:alanyl-tRNA synthetase